MHGPSVLSAESYHELPVKKKNRLMQQAPVTKPHEQDDDNDEIDLMGLLGTLIDHKWLIAGVTGVFMAAGVAYALLATPV